MRNNKGVTLVELLVAIAVGSIVMAGIAVMIFNSIKLYGRTVVSADVQNEAQDTMNLLEDSVLEAKGLDLVQDTVDEKETQYLFLGEFTEVSATEVSYVGRVYQSVYHTTKEWYELYVVEYADGEMTGATKDIVITNIADDIRNHQTEYLAGQYLSSFCVSLAEEERLQTAERTFEEPVLVKIEMGFYKSNASADKATSISKTIQIRNRIRSLELKNYKNTSGTDISGSYQLKK